MDELHSEMNFIHITSDEKERSSSSSSNRTTSSTTTEMNLPLNKYFLIHFNEMKFIPLNLFSLTLESEYETCSSEFDENSSDEENVLDENEKEKEKFVDENALLISRVENVHLSDQGCLSRTDSGVSLQTSSNARHRTNPMRKKRQTYFSTSSTSFPSSSIKKSQSISIISSIFDGFIQSEIECLTCYRRSKTIETFQDLSLPLPSREQLEVCSFSLSLSLRMINHFFSLKIEISFNAIES